MKYEVCIRKEALKFSAAHMTVFPDGSKEALHGHNYQTELRARVEDTGLEALVPFSAFKKALRSVCETWDEKVLLPENCPFLEVRKKDSKEVEFALCGKRYVLPSDEIVWLPVDNVTSETLAGECCRLVVRELEKHPDFEKVKSVELRITETPGQGASCRWKR